MNPCFKKLFFFIYALLFCITATAQVRIEHAEQTKGTLQKDQQALKFIRSFKVLPVAKATSLANTTNKIIDVICRTSQLNPPIGFDAKVNVAASDLGLKETEPHFKVYCYLRYLIKSDNGQVKKSMD